MVDPQVLLSRKKDRILEVPCKLQKLILRPPFAGAGTYDHDHPVPDSYSLDSGARRTSPQSSLFPAYPGAAGSSPTPPSSTSLVVPASGSNGTAYQHTYEVVPGGAPYTGTRHRPSQARQASSSSSASAPEHEQGNSMLPHARVTTAEDARQSESRSRRLMTGYHFGHPRSHSAERESDSKEENSVHGSDSPPLTEAEVEPEPEQQQEQGDEQGQDQELLRQGQGDREEEDVAGKLQDLKLGDRRGSTATMETSSRRRNSRLRDKETGYDRLNGMGDGEADLDETAPQGPGGTEEYLNGQRAYSFPKHRLRTTMKDESKIPVVIGMSTFCIRLEKVQDMKWRDWHAGPAVESL